MAEPTHGAPAPDSQSTERTVTRRSALAAAGATATAAAVGGVPAAAAVSSELDALIATEDELYRIRCNAETRCDMLDEALSALQRQPATDRCALDEARRAVSDADRAMEAASEPYDEALDALLDYRPRSFDEVRRIAAHLLSDRSRFEYFFSDPELVEALLDSFAGEEAASAESGGAS